MTTKIETVEIIPLSAEEINKIMRGLSPVPKTAKRNYGRNPPSGKRLKEQKSPYTRQKIIPEEEFDLSEDVPTIIDTSNDLTAYE